MATGMIKRQMDYISIQAPSSVTDIKSLMNYLVDDIALAYLHTNGDFIIGSINAMGYYNYQLLRVSSVQYCAYIYAMDTIYCCRKLNNNFTYWKYEGTIF